MMRHDDLLIEILTEELPPKSLLTLARAFCSQMEDRLKKASLQFLQIKYYATPRRLALIVQELSEKQPDQEVERRGPSLSAAYNAQGVPSPALLGFIRSANGTLNDVYSIKTDQGEWVGLKQKTLGKNINELVPSMVEGSLAALPIAKRMRWGEGDYEFVRPVQSIILLYGEDIIDAAILGCAADRTTRGHRFQAPDWLTIANAKTYISSLTTEGFVIADFNERQQRIITEAKEAVRSKLGEGAKVYISSQELLDEVTGLVEWPVALCGQYDPVFLNLPKEILISAMQDHQRYFPVINEQGHLLPYFITISNIKTRSPAHVIQGNERVLKARLKDAAFFYAEDQKESLANRLERLKGIVYQAKLGTLYDKAKRVSALAHFIAQKLKLNSDLAARAGLLAKADLTTQLVGEFPELQGIMGYYYARCDNEAADVQTAIKEQYLPRFATDAIPANAIGQVIALADRIDTLVGSFGIKQIPTGDKDPYGLRRAALGTLRILIQSQINLNLCEVINYAKSLYTVNLNLDEAVLLTFIQERMRAWYLEQGISSDIFAAVAATFIANPYDAHKRIQAVNMFKSMSEAQALSIANKRVSNILAKCTENITQTQIDPSAFEHESEKNLAFALAAKHKLVDKFVTEANYEAILLQLAQLREPVDSFFDHVMVMTEDKKKRENRLLLLTELRTLFLKVADIALLQ